MNVKSVIISGYQGIKKLGNVLNVNLLGGIKKLIMLLSERQMIKEIIMIGILILLVGCDWVEEQKITVESINSSKDMEEYIGDLEWSIRQQCDDVKVSLDYGTHRVNITRKDICDSYITLAMERGKKWYTK